MASTGIRDSAHVSRKTLISKIHGKKHGKVHTFLYTIHATTTQLQLSKSREKAAKKLVHMPPLMVSGKNDYK